MLEELEYKSDEVLELFQKMHSFSKRLLIDPKKIDFLDPYIIYQEPPEA